MQDKVKVKRGNLADHLEGPYDLIVANILAEVILRLVDDSHRLLSPSGLFIASGIIEKKRREVESALLQAGFTVVEQITMDDWVCFTARK